MNSFLKRLWVLPVVLVTLFSFSFSAFAEDDVNCTGQIVGKTDITSAAYNSDAGRIDFNDRGRFVDGGFEGLMVDLGILKLAEQFGYAPPREYAGCSEESTTADEYLLKGYAWGDNGGFVSMYCDGSGSGENLGVACGTFDYGVVVGADGSGGGAGLRELTGYAWSDTFGWVSMSGTGGVQSFTSGTFNIDASTSKNIVVDGQTYLVEAGPRDFMTTDVDFIVDGIGKNIEQGSTVEFAEGVFLSLDVLWNETYEMHLDVEKPSFSYGVIRNADGSLTGSAYTEAGVYIVFDGVNLGLPGEEIVMDSWCDGKPWVCVEIEPVVADLDFNLEPGVEGSYPLADGEGAYTIHVYLRNAAGTGPLDSSAYDIDAFFASLKFNWEDTLKLDQFAGSSISTGTVEKEVCVPSKLGETCSMMSFTLDNSEIEEPIATESGGAVVYKPVDNLIKKDFVQDGDDLAHWTLSKQIASFAPSSNGNMSQTTSLSKPTMFKNEIFLYEYEAISDSIEANNLVLNSVEFELTDIGGTPVSGLVKKIFPNGVKDISLKFRPVYELSTLYVNDLQDLVEGFRGIPVNFKIGAKNNKESFSAVPKLDLILDYDVSQTVTIACSDTEENESNTFDFHFLEDLEGNDLMECLACNSGDPENPDTLPECELYGCAEYPETVSEILDKNLSTLFDLEVDLPAVASIGENVENPCTMVAGPALISKISYGFNYDGEKKSIHYYGNKIPRLGGASLANPAAVVHGNVYAQSAFTPNSDVESVQTAGSINVDLVRDTVTENLEKVLSRLDSISGSGKTCVVDGTMISDCSLNSDYLSFVVEETSENVLYFKNSDVVVKNSFSDIDKVLIVDGGNLYINDDFYDTDPSTRLSIVVLRNYEDDFADAGNIYIHPSVQNIQANIVADGSIFSYNGNMLDIGVDGVPVWDSAVERASILNKQLLFEGSISSRNTVGGADLDSPMGGDLDSAREYLLLGTGEVIEAPISLEERLLAQEYDLNYLRLFKLKIEVTSEGYPVDQKCKQGLTYDDLLTFAEGGEVSYNGIACDGIDALNAYPTGDLVVPEEIELAQGLEEDDSFAPVYVYYVAPDQNSFVFSKSGVANLGN